MRSVTILRRSAAVLLGASLAAGFAGAAQAQQPDNWLTRLFQPPPSSSVPASSPPTQ